MACLGAINYDPAAAVTAATTALRAMTALDTTNLQLSFTVPATGNVLVRLMCTVHGATTMPSILLGVLEGATVVGRISPIGGLKNTAVATAMVTQEATFVVTGLTPRRIENMGCSIRRRNSRQFYGHQIRRSRRCHCE